jgi:NADH:ubiquinone oxidoreductase subunit F (NADH-binding)
VKAADLEVVSAVESYPGVGERVLGAVRTREDLTAYLRTGGYAELGDATALLADVQESGLRGRGGAAFPLGRKIRAVRGQRARYSERSAPVVAANGAEGEPASVKDRWLMRYRPHLVLDGLRLAAAMTGADEVHAYVADAESAHSLQRAAAELTGNRIWDADLQISTVVPNYVAGEETALIQAVNGGPALPTDKPPRPFESGIGGRPTLVSNVETLANLPLIQRLGGSGHRPGGTFLLSLTAGATAGLFEVPFGVTLRQVLGWRGEDPVAVAALLMGGYFGGLLAPPALDLPLDPDVLRSAGAGLGCGAVVAMPHARCPVSVAAAVMAYFARESAGQCGSCFNGTAAMSLVLRNLTEHRAGPAEVERLRHWSAFLPGRGACGTLDGAAGLAATLLREFPSLVAGHVDHGCEKCCTAAGLGDRPFALALPSS